MPILQAERERVVGRLRLVVEHVDDLPLVDVPLREASTDHPLSHRVLEVAVLGPVDQGVQQVVGAHVGVRRLQPALVEHVAVATSAETLERVRHTVDVETGRLLGWRLRGTGQAQVEV